MARKTLLLTTENKKICESCYKYQTEKGTGLSLTEPKKITTSEKHIVVARCGYCGEKGKIHYADSY